MLQCSTNFISDNLKTYLKLYAGHLHGFCTYKRQPSYLFCYIKIKIKQQFTLGTGVDCTQVRSLNSEPA